MTEAVSHRPFTGMPLFDHRAVPPTFMVYKVALRQVCLPVPVFVCQYHSTIAPQLPWFTCYHYQKAKRAKSGALSKLQQLWVANCFHFFYEPTNSTVVSVRLKLSFSRLWPSASALILISFYVVGQVLAVLLSSRWSGLELAKIHMGFKVCVVTRGQVLRRIHTNNEKRLLASSCLSVCLHGTASLPLDDFSGNLTFDNFRKPVYKIQVDKNLTVTAGTVRYRDSPRHC